jgi:adenylate kinase family enzyme
MRVYIVGGPGSGKSSLADAIGVKTGAPVVHLDDHWDRTFSIDDTGAFRPEAIDYRRELIDTQLRRRDWVIEGAEPPLLSALAASCDVVVWCDVPFAVAALRMVRRHVAAELAGSNRFPGYRRLFRFLRSVKRRYDAPYDPRAPEWTKWTRAYVANAIVPYHAKTFRSRGGAKNREVATILRALA